MKTKCYVAAALLMVLVSAPMLKADIVQKTLETGKQAIGRVKPLGNTVNDKTIVFYMSGDETGFDLVSRVIQPNGTLGGKFTIAKGLVTENGKMFDVVWNPTSKSYLVVFIKNGSFWGQKVSAIGAKKGVAREISSISSIAQWTLEATAKKRFILLMTRSNSLVGQLLTKKGKKKNNEVTLVKGSLVGQFLQSSTSTPNGKVIITYLSRSFNSPSGQLMSMHVNETLKHVGGRVLSYVNGIIPGITKPNLLVQSDYNADDDVYMVVWHVGGASYYGVYSGDNDIVHAPSAISTRLEYFPTELVYNGSAGLFMLNTFRYDTVQGSGGTLYYLSMFSAAGDLMQSTTQLASHKFDPEGFGFGVSKFGSLIMVYSPEKGPVGVYATMIIAN